MPLELVTPLSKRSHKQMYELPGNWEDAINAWLNWLRLGGMGRNTLILRRNQVRNIARRSGVEDPAGMTIEKIVEACSGTEWTNEYRKGVRGALISFFDFCVVRELATHNPATSLPRVPDSPPNPKPATDSVWFALLEKAGPRERLMARLAGEAGMRRAEVACSHYDDLLEDMDGYALIVHGKGGKQRVVPITDDLARAIQEWTRKGYLFPGVDRWGHHDAPHLTPTHVGKLISDLMPPGWTMHKLRHRYATRGHNGTGNLRAVQEALGHASVATTQKYVAVSKRDIRAVSDAAFKATPQ